MGGLGAYKSATTIVVSCSPLPAIAEKQTFVVNEGPTERYEEVFGGQIGFSTTDSRIVGPRS